ncbi:MAG: acyl-CoA dehydrogenase family protein [Anaerolineae bacterium]|nr:acyl-CoA dehydrogenase family protein [Anaerolineae bacterium]MDW8171767.1 acyl-CoA dehydrogenase family protein [Anaerolineae bacterium]
MLNTPAPTTLDAFDFYRLDDQLTDKQRALRNRVRDWVQTVVLPNINPYWEKAEFPRELAMRLLELPIMGGPLATHGCAGLDFIEIGLVTYELAKGDGSIGTFFGVHSGLAMGSIGTFGSEEQKDRWLAPMARLEKIGAFGLTEPEVGSNAVGIKTTARKDGDGYILNGAKRWIGNAEIADLLIIWARDEEGKFGGYVIEDPRNTEGVTMTNIGGKVGKRAVWNADIHLENVRVPIANKLPGVTSFKSLALVLGVGRYGVSWEAAGIAAAAFEFALDYAKKREQFGKPIASFQLIQHKLVEMATEVTLMQNLCMQLGRLLSNFQMSEGMVSMAKYNNARKARYVTQLAREIMDGNGILIENHVARLWTDAEVVYTYEGTNEVNLLIVGRELTGIQAIV